MIVEQIVTEEELRQAFADTLDKGASSCAIMVAYDDGSRLPRLVVGVPYEINNGRLEIGPYLKDIFTAPPMDYNQSKKQIPISDIKGFRRIELSDIC